MAVKRKFSIENESSEPNEAPAPQKEAGPEAVKNESIDSLVSSFLAELTGLSSEMKHQAETAEVDPVAKPGTAGITLPPFIPAEDFGTQQEYDLQGIADEIEKSLAELENLKSLKAVHETPAVESPAEPVVAVKESVPSKPELPAAPSAPAPKIPVSRPRPLPPKDSEELAWSKLDMFRNSYIPARRRRKIQMILAAIIVIGILVISAYFLLKAAAQEVEIQAGIHQQEERIQPGAHFGYF